MRKLAKSQRLYLYQFCSDMIHAELPLYDALLKLQQQGGKLLGKSFSNKLKTLTDKMRESTSISAVFEELIPRDELSVIHAAERSGSLADGFLTLVNVIRYNSELTQKLISAVIFPIIMLVLALIVIAGYAVKVFPAFEEVVPIATWPSVTQALYHFGNALIEGLWLKIVLIVTAAIFLITGSFLNVVIYRLPLMLCREEAAAPALSLSWPPSHCPSCKQKVLKRDNVPVLSWLLLRGRCRHCQTPISAQYPLIEALTGAVFLLITLSYVPEYSEVQLGLFALMFAILLCLSVIDLHHLLLPDPLVFLLLWSGLGASALGYLPLRLSDAVLGVIVSWALLSALRELYQTLRKVEGLGYGDVKLFAAGSAWCGLQALPQLILASALFGLVAHILSGIRRRRPAPLDQPAYFPFGPSIAMAALLLFHLNLW